MTSETGNAEVASMSAEVLRAKASEAYARQSRESDEQKWIIEYLPMVRHIVNKVTTQMSPSMDTDDLISAGTLGLVKAARGFDTSRDVEFKTYAYIRIKGAVIDELRSRSFVPAAMYSQIRRVKDAYNEFAAAAGRPPSDEELATRADLSLSKLYRTLEEARKQNFLSIHGLSEDAPLLGLHQPADTSPSPADQAERNELSGRLAKAIMELPQRDRTIVLLYYERDLTMKESAQVLEITESRVSQLHASALFKLAMKLRTQQ